MKRTISLAVALCLLANLSVVSCKKESKISHQSLPRSSTVAFIIGSGNSLNNLGDVHNQSLDEITLDANFPNLSEEDEFDIIKPFIDIELSSTNSLVYSDISSGVAHVTSSETNRFNLPDDLYTDGRITSDVKDYLLDIYDIAGFIENQTQSGVRDAQDVIDDIEDLEQDIISDYGQPSTNVDVQIDMETDEGKSTYLLAICAITKYSYGYWENVRDDPNHDWFDDVYPPGSDDSGKRFWDTKFGKFLTRCWHDVCGFAEEGPALVWDNEKKRFVGKLNIISGVIGAAKASSKK